MSFRLIWKFNLRKWFFGKEIALDIFMHRLWESGDEFFEGRLYLGNNLFRSMLQQIKLWKFNHSSIFLCTV